MTLTAKSVSCSQRSPKIMIRPCFTRATKRNIQTHTHTHRHRHRHRHRHTHNETHQNRRTYCASQTFCKEGVARGERHIHKHTHTHTRKKHTQALSACRRWCQWSFPNQIPTGTKNIQSTEYNFRTNVSEFVKS